MCMCASAVYVRDLHKRNTCVEACVQCTYVIFAAIIFKNCFVIKIRRSKVLLFSCTHLFSVNFLPETLPKVVQEKDFGKQ